jgi:hypothetical protein
MHRRFTSGSQVYGDVPNYLWTMRIASRPLILNVVPRAMERYRDEVERMEQLGDSPRPQRVVRARTALRTLLGDIRLQPNGDHLVAQFEVRNEALALISGDVANGYSGGPLRPLARAPEPPIVLDFPLLAA